MPTNILYYLNGPSLSSSTAVFLDADLQTCAPDGYYYDGLIVRQQTDCVLSPSFNCSPCGSPCPEALSELNTNGVYYINVVLNEFLGAVIVTLNPQSLPIGIQVEYNNVIYNKVSSGPAGLLQGLPNLPIFVGNNTSGCTLSYSPTIYNLDKYNYVSSSFSLIGSENVTIYAGQDLTTTFDPGDCFILIPKTVSDPQFMTIKVITTCPNTPFDISYTCPELLPTYDSSVRLTGSELYWCTVLVDKKYYHYSIGGTPGVIGIGDFVSLDKYGANPLPDGNYRTDAPYDLIYTVSSGVVVSFLACP